VSALSLHNHRVYRLYDTKEFSKSPKQLTYKLL